MMSSYFSHMLLLGDTVLGIEPMHPRSSACALTEELAVWLRLALDFTFPSAGKAGVPPHLALKCL